MNISPINQRCEQIISMLLSENEYLSVREIADVMQVSKRTIYSDISDINYWLKAYQLPELEVARGESG